MENSSGRRSGTAVARGKKKQSSGETDTRNRAIWSAKCEEFPRVVRALSVTSIDMTSIYHRWGRFGSTGNVGTEISREMPPHPAEVLSRHDDVDDVVIATTLVRSRLDTRIHCRAFLMTEEILSYTHPFRTPRWREDVLFPSGCAS